MKKNLSSLFVFLFLTAGAFSRPDVDAPGSGTEEKQTLRFAVDPEFAPFEIPGEDGRLEGVAGDFLRQISERTGYQFEYVPTDSWSESLNLMKSGEIELLPCIGFSRERLEFLNYSKPYLQFARVLIATHDNMDADPSRLEGIRVGVQRNSSHHGYANEQNIEVELFDTFEGALLALAEGTLDGVIGNLATSMYTIQNLSLTHLRVAGRMGDSTFELHIGVRKGLDQELQAINTALDAISPKTRNRILDTWFPLPLAPKKDLMLTRSEKEWLLLNPRIRVGWDPAWAPVEFANNKGYPQGISFEYVKALENILGIRFIFEPPRPWTETEQMIREKEIDLMSCVGFSSDREPYLELTEPYIESRAVIYTREENPYILNLNHLAHRNIAVLEDYTLTRLIEDAYPEIRFVYVDTVEEAFSALQEGEVTAYVGSLLTGNYYLSKIRPHNIKISGETDLDVSLHMGVRNDWSPFVQILNKALKEIPEEDRIAFYRKWMWVRYDKAVHIALFVKVILLGVAGVLLFGVWNRRLAKEINLRKQAEEKLKEKQAEIQAQVEELQKLEQLKDNLIHMVVHDMRTPLTVIQGAVELIQDELSDTHELAEKSVDWLNKAQVSSDELIHMVTDLLDVSRLETGKMPIHPVPASLKEEADRVARSLSPLADQYQSEIRVEGTNGDALFDVSLIRRVLNNFITNAFKACGTKGDVQLSISETSEHVRIDVRDNGRGIREKDLGRIFEKFIQADGTHDTTNPNSSGLGLAFCQLTIQAHNGRIGVDSEWGKGSTFWFELPKSRS